MPSTLQTLISNIPTAEDGHVIERRYHNSLRDAITAMAAQIEAAPGGAETARTFAPSFLPIFDAGTRSPEWLLSVGIASKPGGNSAQGWFPVQLPEGATIRSLTVVGQRIGAVLSCQVQLLRQTIADAGMVPIITVNLKNVLGQPFKETREVTGASGAVIADFRSIDNDRYQYHIKAFLQNAASDAVVDLYSFQIAFVTS